jgi:hypothetical protein
VKARIGAAATRVEAGLAYDAAMVTLLGMSAHNGNEPITGLAIRSAMSRLNDTTSTVVSFGEDPAKFVKTAITEIGAGKTIDIDGASGPLNYRSDGTICGDLVAFELAADAKSLVPADTFTASCPEGLTGTWAPAPELPGARATRKGRRTAPALFARPADLEQRGVEAALVVRLHRLAERDRLRQQGRRRRTRGCAACR